MRLLHLLADLLEALVQLVEQLGRVSLGSLLLQAGKGVRQQVTLLLLERMDQLGSPDTLLGQTLEPPEGSPHLPTIPVLRQLVERFRHQLLFALILCRLVGSLGSGLLVSADRKLQFRLLRQLWLCRIRLRR